jgi:membrane associated rhomboid family serine protease
MILIFEAGEFTNPFRLITYMFLHANFTHLFFNMFSLWMFGRILEQALGTKRFLLYYFVCGIGAGLVQLLVCWIEWKFLGGIEISATLGASGAVFGILLAFGMLFPNERIMLLIPPIPMKAKWFVIIYGAMELIFGIGGRQSGVAHFAHLGGMLFGLLLILWWRNKARRRR